MNPNQISFLLKRIGNPIAYHPGIAKLIGVKEAVFLGQLLYWTGKQADPDGWIYKTQEDFFDETGMSKKEQLTARKNLKSKGLLEEIENRITHKMSYRPCPEALDTLFDGGGAISQRDIPESPNGRSANLPTGAPRISQQEIRLYTETTTKSTQVQPKARGTLPEVKAFCSELDLPASDAEWFFYKCEGNGWTNGGKPIKDWKATVRSWKAGGYLPSHKTGQTSRPEPHKPFTGY